MDKRTIGIIATIASVILCACPGMCLCIFGAVTAAGFMPYEYTLGNEGGSGMVPQGYGIAALVFALLLIAIPIVVGLVLLRKKPNQESANVITGQVPDDF